MRNWLEHALRLKHANQLVGDVKFNIVFMQTSQYFTFFQAFVVLGGFALVGISLFNAPEGSVLNSCTLQVLFFQAYLSLAIGIVLIAISLMYGYLGNTLFI